MGDFKVGIGHILDGTGRFRWGLGLAATFDTASKPQFGDGALQVAPVWGGGFRFSPDFELVANVQYNASLTEANARDSISLLELNPALLKIWPRHWYSLLGWNSGWDFEDGGFHSGKLQAEIGKGLGHREQWVVYTGIDIPVIHGGEDNFTLRIGLNYVFN